VYQSYTSRLTELWSLPKLAQGLNTYNKNNNPSHYTENLKFGIQFIFLLQTLKNISFPYVSHLSNWYSSSLPFCLPSYYSAMGTFIPETHKVVNTYGSIKHINPLAPEFPFKF